MILGSKMSTDPESTTRTPTSEKSIRLLRPSVVVLCGPAACGKSTFAARHFRPTQIISSDQARALVCDDERDQRYSAEAFALVSFIIEQRLNINRLCVVDSTALTPEARKSLLDLARKYRVPCVVLLFDISLETCLARDQARERSVGQPVIERQYRLFVQESGNIEREGFDQLIKLRNEDLDKVRIDVLFRPLPRPSGTAERPEPRRAAFGPPARNRRSYTVLRSPAQPAPPAPALRPSSPAPQPPVSSPPPVAAAPSAHQTLPSPLVSPASPQTAQSDAAAEPRPSQPISPAPSALPQPSSGEPSPSKQ